MRYTWKEIDAMIGDAATRQNSVLLGDGRNMEALAGMLCGDITNLVTIIEQFRPGRVTSS